MKSSTKIILVTVAALAGAIALLALFNRGDIALKAALAEAGAFEIVKDGERVGLISMENIEEIGLTEFEAVLDTSIASPRQVKLIGVELRDILAYTGVEYSNLDRCEVKGLDGYASAITAGELADPGRVYICVAMDGKPLGDKSSGGTGPFMMVVAGERFSMRWCKYVERVELK